MAPDMPPVAYELYEVCVALAEARRFVRVRQSDATLAAQDVLAHYPGWGVQSIHRWAGEGWVRA